MEQTILNNIYPMLPSVLKLKKQLFFDYDEGADVLYISFGKPTAASDSELLPNDILVRYKGKKIIGVTIINASRFLKK